MSCTLFRRVLRYEARVLKNSRKYSGNIWSVSGFANPGCKATSNCEYRIHTRARGSFAEDEIALIGMLLKQLFESNLSQ